MKHSQIPITPHVFNYEGKNITFSLGNGDVMVNATQMAKAFGKRPSRWLALPSTKEFLACLSGVRKSDTVLIQSDSGGKNGGGGTWLHEDVALEFARWLSPKFAIWCNDRIKTLLKHGVVATDSKIEDFLSNPDLAIQAFTALKQERERSRVLENLVSEKQNQIQVLESQIKDSLPKTRTYDEIMSSNGLLTTTQIAKCYGWTARKLNKVLHNLGIQYKQSGQWLIYARYQHSGYTKAVPFVFTHNNGDKGTAHETKWTYQGREFIHDLLKKEGFI